MAVAATPSALSFGDLVLLRATIYSSNIANRVAGTVTFRDGDVVLGTSPVDDAGQAALSVSNLAVGTHSITAELSGSDLPGSISSPLDVPVRRATVQPMTDLAYTPQSSRIGFLANVNGRAFFFANEGVRGYELWKSDGTTAGTVLVRDINPGSGDALGWTTDPHLTNVGGTVFFIANDGTHGTELWKSDGTAAGTVMVKDIYPGSNNAFDPVHRLCFSNVNGTLFFTADDGTHGIELWKTDGTAEGTVLVKDILAGNGSSDPAPMTNVNGTLFFAANDGIDGRRLWKSDGTEAGTVLVSAGQGPSTPEGLININGVLYFAATEAEHGTELWKSDGTAGGTVLVKDINAGPDSGVSSSGSSLTNINGTLFFTAYDVIHGNELWKSDGTADGTVVVKDIVPGFSWSSPQMLTEVNGTLFFRLNNGELWKSDGTSDGTVLVKGIYPASGSYRVISLANVNGTLFFEGAPSMADHPTLIGVELWKSDGTADGTVLVKDMIPEGEDKPGSYAAAANSLLISVNGSLLFTMNDRATGNELWKSDGTANGTVLVKDINPWTFRLGATNLTAVGETLYFTGDDGSHGLELWKSDGTKAGTTLISDILPGPGSSASSYWVNFNGTLFFAADDSVHGKELWRSDGTAAGTFMVKDIRPGIGGSSPGNLTVVGDALFFTAYDEVSGSELWKSDGTTKGTVLVRDIVPGTGSGLSPSLACLTNAGGTLFFVANDNVSGLELWKSDGTRAGTVLVKDIRPGVASSQPFSLVSVGRMLFFGAGDGTTYGLWKTNGTAAGTVLLKRLSSATDSSVLSMANAGGTLFFTADDGAAGLGLWKSEGTFEGTVLVKDIYPGRSYYDPIPLTNVDGILYFPVADLAHGSELWRSDGTDAGTVLVKDISPGTSDAIIPRSLFLTNVNGTLYFVAGDATNGRELWKSDGTANGTVMVRDIGPGVVGSNPGGLTAINGRLWFTADDGRNGNELWATVLPIASSDDYTVLAGETLTVSGPGVLGNDSDPGGGALAASLVAGPAHGTLTFDSDGAFRYVPQANYTGTDSFVYEAVDVDGGRTRSTVSLSVMAPVSVYGSAGDDMFYVCLDPTHTLLQVWQNAPSSGQPTDTWPVAGISMLSFTGLDGSDELTIDCSNGSPIPAMGIAFAGGNGVDTLRVTGTSASGVLSVDSSGLLLNSKPVTTSDVEQGLLGGPSDLPV